MAIKQKLMIYGATGYTGKLIARLAGQCGVRAVLAGRHEQRVADLAGTLGLPYRVFSLETPEQRDMRFRGQRLTSSRDREAVSPNRNLDAELADIQVVINAASPFSETALPLARACIRTQTHYVDICGEYDVFRALDDLHQPAIARGVLIAPGAGLTVLGSDVLVARASLALATKKATPHLVRVALSRVPVISRGSAKTMLDSVRDGLLVRRNGSVQTSPVGGMVRGFAFDDPARTKRHESRLCMGMTLADISSAGRTAWQHSPLEGTEAKPRVVPNVETYVEASSLERASYEAAGNFALALRSKPIKRALDAALSLWPEGPQEHEREAAPQQIVVEVEDAYRRVAVARLSAPNSYDFTAAVALRFALLIQGDRRSQPRRGFASPAQVFSPSDLRDHPQSSAAKPRKVAESSVQLLGFS